MGKIDLKFYASTVGVFGVILGIGGHGANMWLAQNPGFTSETFSYSAFAQYAIYLGAALWMWALSLLARSRGRSNWWALSGTLMLLPFVGILPWFVLLALKDRLDVENEIYQEARTQLLNQQRDTNGMIVPRFASDAISQQFKPYRASDEQADPWVSAGYDRRDQALKPVVVVRPKIITDTKYRW